MSKAVLIMEMPDSCRECKLFVQSMFYYCAAKDYETEDKWIDQCEWLRHNYAAERPGWCPLKPLPNEERTSNLWDEYYDGFVDGRNSFRSEILED